MSATSSLVRHPNLPFYIQNSCLIHYSQKVTFEKSVLVRIRRQAYDCFRKLKFSSNRNKNSIPCIQPISLLSLSRYIPWVCVVCIFHYR